MTVDGTAEVVLVAVATGGVLGLAVDFLGRGAAARVLSVVLVVEATEPTVLAVLLVVVLPEELLELVTVPVVLAELLLLVFC